MNRAEQAVVGLQVTRGSGVVMIYDGFDRWLVWESAFDRALEALETRAPYADVDDDTPGSGQAYQELCDLTRRYSVDLASANGSGKGVRRLVVRAAVEAGLIGRWDALRLYGVELADRVAP